MGATPGLNKLRKKELVKKGKINCGYCRCNRGENKKRRGRTDKYKEDRHGKAS